MIKRCPITYEIIPESERYSIRGLKLLSPKLHTLHDLPFNIHELQQLSLQRASKMSIQGVQLKFSARLNIKDNCFQPIERGGEYIFKPQSTYYQQLPENEDLTMKMAASIGIEVPVHGLIYGKDNQLTYFIKRFDRYGRHQKYAVEDFSQLSGLSRDEKYSLSMEHVAKVIEKNCSFPLLEYQKLLLRLLFCFLIGNEDMHLKNFSIIRRNHKVELSPTYDLLNSSIAIVNWREELALPLHGKKRNLTYNDWIAYYAKERLQLSDKVIESILVTLQQALPQWQTLIDISFLDAQQKENYHALLLERYNRLFKSRAQI